MRRETEEGEEPRSRTCFRTHYTDRFYTLSEMSKSARFSIPTVLGGGTRTKAIIALEELFARSRCPAKRDIGADRRSARQICSPVRRGRKYLAACTMTLRTYVAAKMRTSNSKHSERPTRVPGSVGERRHPEMYLQNASKRRKKSK